MWLKEIWRYPVKSMAGESLDSAELTAYGVRGDRMLAARAPTGRILTARTRPLLLRHRATLDPAGTIWVDGLPWDSPEIAGAVEAAAGPGVRLAGSDPHARFDVLPLLVATDGMLEAVGEDRRRFRPNLVIGGVSGLAEREWEGARLRIGGAVVSLADLRARCIMTTFDPDTGEQDAGVLRRIQREFDGVLGLNAGIAVAGSIRVGEEVELIRTGMVGW
jgi:uncharacterized protein YcbX